LDDAESYTAAILRAHLAEAIQRAVDDIDLSQPPYSYGIDSLMAVKLRAWIGEKMKADVTLFDILNAKSIQDLASKVAKVSQLVPQEFRGVE
jgi:acyl carrier protein